jgi:hypothetical protein
MINTLQVCVFVCFVRNVVAFYVSVRFNLRQTTSICRHMRCDRRFFVAHWRTLHISLRLREVRDYVSCAAVFRNVLKVMFDLLVEDYVDSLRLDLTDATSIDRSRQAERLLCLNLLDATNRAFAALSKPLIASEVLSWWQQVVVRESI